MNRYVSATAWILAAAFTAMGCTPSGATPSGEAARPGGNQVDRPLVELFSWWTAPGEAEALQALVDQHSLLHPEARLFNAAAASGASARETLADRLLGHRPPDLLQENVHDLRAYVAKHPDTYVPLDNLFADLQLGRALFPEVIADVTLDGHVFAMPVNLHRENALFYNKAIFEAHHLFPPTTFEELLSVCRTLKMAGVTPIATAYQGWILRIMFNSIAMGRMGITAYRDFFTGRSTDGVPLLREAIAAFGNILANYTNADAAEPGFGWTTAAQAVKNGDAAMYLHGDWAKGYLTQLGWKPGTDFGVVGAPGASEMFLYGVDVFALPRGATNERGARQFLATIASTQGQEAFNKLKGSSPVRMDVALDQLDVLGRRTLADLKRAKVRMLMHGRPMWDDAIEKFARNRDAEALLAAFTAPAKGD